MKTNSNKINNKTKKTILALSIILLIAFGIICIINYICNYPQIEKNELPGQVESFFNNNKTVLNEFVKICYDNEVEYIAEKESRTDKDKRICEMNGYYVYSKDDLSDSTKGSLLKELKIFQQNNITEVFVEEDYVSIMITKIINGAIVKYVNNPCPIDEIRDRYYTDNAWYIDDNWVIIMNEFL